MKRERFDPCFQRMKLRRKHEAISTLQDKAQDFRCSVEAVLASSLADLDAELCDPLSRDLILVAALGGLEGVECLKAACGSSWQKRAPTLGELSTPFYMQISS